jgi:hypothetical protein
MLTVMAEPEERTEDIVDLQGLVEQWGQEFAIERELAGLGTDPEATWVPLAEAERQAGVSRSTLRAWYRSGQIASRLMPGPHGLQRLVPLEIVLDRASRSPRTGPRAGDAGDASEKEPEMSTGLTTPDAVVRLAELATTAATERAEAAEARAAETELALRAALERAAAAEAELRLLRRTDPA